MSRCQHTRSSNGESIPLPVVRGFHDSLLRILQFLSDVLGHFIDAENLQKHWLKLLVLSRHLRKESVLWPESGIISLLEAAFVAANHREAEWYAPAAQTLEDLAGDASGHTPPA